MAWICPSWVNRYRGDPAASSAMSAVTPKAEVNSECLRPRYGPLRVDDPAVGVIQALKPEPQIMRYELNDFEWTAIKPMLPNKPRSVRRVNDRRVLNGIFWVRVQVHRAQCSLRHVISRPLACPQMEAKTTVTVLTPRSASATHPRSARPPQVHAPWSASSPHPHPPRHNPSSSTPSLRPWRRDAPPSPWLRRG